MICGSIVPNPMSFERLWSTCDLELVGYFQLEDVLLVIKNISVVPDLQ